jgi:hypothetical protein
MAATRADDVVSSQTKPRWRPMKQCHSRRIGHRVREAAGLAHHRWCAIARRIHLRETAGFESCGRKANVRAGMQAMGERFADRRRLRPLSARRSAVDRGAGEPAQQMCRARRGSWHGSGRVPTARRLNIDEHMASAKVLSCRVLHFEPGRRPRLPPGRVPGARGRVGCHARSRHDAGHWAENDIAARAELGMYKSADEERQRGPTARGTSSFFCRRFAKRGCGILAGPSRLRGYPTRSTSISRDRGRKGKADTWPAPTR